MLHFPKNKFLYVHNGAKAHKIVQKNSITLFQKSRNWWKSRKGWNSKNGSKSKNWTKLNIWLHCVHFVVTYYIQLVQPWLFGDILWKCGPHYYTNVMKIPSGSIYENNPKIKSNGFFWQICILRDFAVPPTENAKRRLFRTRWDARSAKPSCIKRIAFYLSVNSSRLTTVFKTQSSQHNHEKPKKTFLSDQRVVARVDKSSLISSSHSYLLNELRKKRIILKIHDFFMHAGREKTFKKAFKSPKKIKKSVLEKSSNMHIGNNRTKTVVDYSRSFYLK